MDTKLQSLGSNTITKTITGFTLKISNSMENITIDTEDLSPQRKETTTEETKTDLIVNVDGSCSPNPGGDMWGGVYISYCGRKLWSIAKAFLGHVGTNNMAEILITIYGLKALKRIQEKYPQYDVPSTIISDSMLIVQAIERGSAKSPALDDCVDEFLKIRDTMRNKPRVIWRKREVNTRADSRSR